MPWYRIVHFCIMGLGLLTGIIRFPKLNYGSRGILVLLILTFITEVIAWTMSVWGEGNFIIYHFFIIIQFLILYQAFRNELVNLRRVILIAQCFMVGVGIVNILFNSGHLNSVYPTFLRTLFNLLVIGISLIYLRELLNRQTDYSFNQYPLFWLSLGWLLFSVITLFNFSAFNYLTNSIQKADLLFRYIRIAANFMLYIMFILAFLSNQRHINEIAAYGKQR